MHRGDKRSPLSPVSSAKRHHCPQKNPQVRLRTLRDRAASVRPCCCTGFRQPLREALDKQLAIRHWEFEANPLKEDILELIRE